MISSRGGGAAAVVLYVGLDDTDVVDDAGTGQLARSLARRLVRRVPGTRLEGVSRHQLLRDPRIACTRRNRCSCVVLRVARDAVADAVALARAHVQEGAVAGSDPGLCVAEARRLGSRVLDWARRAKREVLDRGAALEMARAAGIVLEPLGGTGDGVIGALAAVGLRASADDGWLTQWAGIRDLAGPLPVSRLLAEGLEAVEDEQSRPLGRDELVETRGRVRPALRRGRRVLLVQRDERGIWAAVKPDDGGA